MVCHGLRTRASAAPLTSTSDDQAGKEWCIGMLEVVSRESQNTETLVANVTTSDH